MSMEDREKHGSAAKQADWMDGDAECQMVIVDEVLAERERQIKLGLGGDTEAFDRSNTANDWIAYVTGYLGRAARKMSRNDREKQGFRENMVKAAALCLAAIEAYDKGYMEGANDGSE